MSRLIINHTNNEEDKTFRNTEKGKLLLTKYRQSNTNIERNLALLIKNNRLIQAVVREEDTSRVGDIYLGKIKKVQHNLDACFVEIADKEQVFLPLSQCKAAFIVNRKPDGRILEGDELPVQIEKDAVKTKLASATAKITLTGRYAVFSAGSVHTGISAKLKEEEKLSLQSFLQTHGLTDEKGNWCGFCDDSDANQPKLPAFGAVLRTEAGKTEQDILLQEILKLQDRFVKIFSRASHATCFTRLSEPTDAWINCITAIPSWEYDEAVTDDPHIFREVSSYLESQKIPLRLYTDTAYSLNKLYGVDTKMEDALSRRIWLKSGAYLILDTTEALTVFDVNTGKYDARRASADTFYKINLEAAEEIALQLKLRNLSGIILVDFINLNDKNKDKELLDYMKQLVRQDRINTSVVDITPLGLMEITRQKRNKPHRRQ